MTNMTDINDHLLNYLRSAKHATVWLEQLEGLFVGKSVDYNQFATAVIQLENAGLLSAIKSAGRNGKSPSLAHRYRITTVKLKADFQQRLHKLRMELHPLISIDRYYALGESSFNADAPYIELIHRYLTEHGLPEQIHAAPERSYALVGDEKWITEKSGKALLQRIGLWDKLLIEAEYDPLMMAFNPGMAQYLSDTASCLHLIVENKTTFQALLPVLPETVFHTLIYGCGNKIVGNITMFPRQYPLLNREHRFYYFGDIDHKGIQIWHDVSRKTPMAPALPFYNACIQKASAEGKGNQHLNEQALRMFLDYFAEHDRQRIGHSLATGHYYPQETLSTEELQTIWRETDWH